MEKKLLDNKKKVVFIILNVFGLIIFMLGGAKLLAYISIAIIFFLIGKFTEKAIQFVKDYRLQMKVNRMDITYKEVQKIKEENEFLKNLLKDEKRKIKVKEKAYSLDDLEIE